ncbi:MAG: polyisoprenyl-phosphate glycosyltransferase [Solirubrobacteraceae bacterium]|nr:polyisoprenyl-phosphate glycosyltransferase [Solirubrobacteraceae bacterium]
MTAPPPAAFGSAIEISVVVPTYACATCLHALHERLTATLGAMAVEYELIFVDDRAQDGSWDVLAQLAAADPHVRAFRMSRNFGQHMAITAGLAEATGAWVVVMDCDLQDPPEQIPRLYAKAREGHDIVLARRVQRQDARARNLAGGLYFRLLNLVAGTAIDRSYGTFSIVSRQVAGAYLQFRDRDRHYLFILYWLGFNQATIDVPAAARHAGRSSYGTRALLRHALDGLMFQTTVVLRWIVYAGFALASVGALLAAFFVVSHLTRGSAPGWTSIATMLLLLTGFSIASSGVVGLYVGKTFEQVKQRPLYVISEQTERARTTVAPALEVEPSAPAR